MTKYPSTRVDDDLLFDSVNPEGTVLTLYTVTDKQRKNLAVCLADDLLRAICVHYAAGARQHGMQLTDRGKRLVAELLDLNT